jgi:hypothetical protein
MLVSWDVGVYKVGARTSVARVLCVQQISQIYLNQPTVCNITVGIKKNEMAAYFFLQ